MSRTNFDLILIKSELERLVTLELESFELEWNFGDKNK